MDISVTDFKANCLDLIRKVEKGGPAITIKRRGRTVARLTAPLRAATPHPKPWERLRGSGTLLASPEESVLRDEDFEAMR